MFTIPRILCKEIVEKPTIDKIRISLVFSAQAQMLITVRSLQVTLPHWLPPIIAHRSILAFAVFFSLFSFPFPSRSFYSHLPFRLSLFAFCLFHSPCISVFLLPISPFISSRSLTLSLSLVTVFRPRVHYSSLFPFATSFTPSFVDVLRNVRPNCSQAAEKYTFLSLPLPLHSIRVERTL